jgi:hypothetical protein
MNVTALAAGWPFAVLLILYARCDDRAPLCGMVIDKDNRSKALVLERDGIVYSVRIDVANTICGVDGYPISMDDIRVGAYVEIVQQRHGPT